MLVTTYKRAFHELLQLEIVCYACDMDQASPKKKKNIRPIAERMAEAIEAQQRAAERLARKTVKVQKYQAAQKQRDRKLDTRRKIIAGALALEHMRYDGTFGAAFRDLLNTYVTSDRERVLFGLPPLPDAETPTTRPAANSNRSSPGPNAYRELGVIDGGFSAPE